MSVCPVWVCSHRLRIRSKAVILSRPVHLISTVAMNRRFCRCWGSESPRCLFEKERGAQLSQRIGPKTAITSFRFLPITNCFRRTKSPLIYSNIGLPESQLRFRGTECRFMKQTPVIDSVDRPNIVDHDGLHQ